MLADLLPVYPETVNPVIVIIEIGLTQVGISMIEGSAGLPVMMQAYAQVIKAPGYYLHPGWECRKKIRIGDQIVCKGPAVKVFDAEPVYRFPGGGRDLLL